MRLFFKSIMNPTNKTVTEKEKDKSSRIATVIKEWSLLFIIMLACIVFCSELIGPVSKSHENEVMFTIYAAIIPFLIALAFSVKGVWDSLKQEKSLLKQEESLLKQEERIETQRARLQDITGHLEKISKQMSTRHLDPFPGHLQDIIKLLEGAQKSFHILTDCADYGSFSNPEEHWKMIRAIRVIHASNEGRSEEKKVKIEIQICGKFQLISRSSEFWEMWDAAQANRGNRKLWETLRNDPKFQGRLIEFCRRNKQICNRNHKSSFDLANCSMEDFEEIMLKKHDAVKNVLEDYGVVFPPYTEPEHSMPGIFFWMKDGKEAIFLLSHTGANAQGMAFYTRDDQIMEILKTTWKNISKKNADHPPHIEVM